MRRINFPLYTNNNKAGIVTEIMKRDGTHQVFDETKIKEAIRNAFISTSSTLSEEELSSITNEVTACINKEHIGVEVIQDKVEETLMAHHYYKEAKSYILYRQKRSENRAYYMNSFEK